MAGWLKNTFRPGLLATQLTHQWLNGVANFINTLEIEGGVIVRTPDFRRCLIIPDEQTDNASRQLFSWQVIRLSDTQVYVCNGYCTYAALEPVLRGGITIDITEACELYIHLNALSGIWDDVVAAPTLPRNDGDDSYFRIASIPFPDGAIGRPIQRRSSDIEESKI